MWSFLLRIWESGVATEPTRRLLDPAPPAYRGAPVLDAKRCNGCGSCARLCPAGAIALAPDGTAGMVRWTLHLGQCVFCGLCSETCPAEALLLSETYALAALRPGDLLISARVRGGGVPG